MGWFEQDSSQVLEQPQPGGVMFSPRTPREERSSTAQTRLVVGRVLPVGEQDALPRGGHPARAEERVDAGLHGAHGPEASDDVVGPSTMAQESEPVRSAEDAMTLPTTATAIADLLAQADRAAETC